MSTLAYERIIMIAALLAVGAAIVLMTDLPPGAAGVVGR